MTDIPREARIAFIRSRAEHTVHAALGATFTSFDPVTVEVPVTDRLRQETGIVHGGVYVVLAESAASVAAALEVDIGRYNVAGQSLTANHLRPVRDGRLRASPRLVHAGRTTRIYDVEVVRTDDDGGRPRPASLVRIAIAVRPWGEDGPPVP